MQELGITQAEFERLPPETQAQLTSKFAKYKATQLMGRDAILERDSARLHRKAEAVYKHHGLSLDAPCKVASIVADDVSAPSKEALQEVLGVTDDDDVRIVADNVTIGEGATSKAEDAPAKSSVWPNLLMAGLTAAAIGSGAGLTWLLTRPADTTDKDTQATIGVLP